MGKAHPTILGQPQVPRPLHLPISPSPRISRSPDSRFPTPDFRKNPPLSPFASMCYIPPPRKRNEDAPGCRSVVSRPLRNWLKNTLGQRRLFARNRPGAKPPLLWLADLPRLGAMWIGHFWFRTWLPVRLFGRRLAAGAAAMFSAVVGIVQGAGHLILDPISSLRAGFRGVSRWLAGGGIARTLVRLANGTLEGLLALPGASLAAVVWLTRTSSDAVLGLLALLSAGLVGMFSLIWSGIRFLAGLAGITAIAAAIAAALGLGSIGQGIAALWRRATAALAALWAGLQTPQEIAWTFTAVTGTIGLILLIVFQTSSVPNLAQAGDPNQGQTVVPPQPQRVAIVPEVHHEELTKPLPDPFRSTEHVESTIATLPVMASKPSLPMLVARLRRTELPSDVTQFGGPIFDETFRVVSLQPQASTAESLPADDWLRNVSARGFALPAAPAAYRTTHRTNESAGGEVEPRSDGDPLVPGRRGVRVTIERTQPVKSVVGRLLWYELIVTNESSRRLPSLMIEEHVAAPHRVADAFPPARFSDRMLSWRLAGLEAGETRRLRVGVYPTSEAPIETSATVRSLTTVSAITKVTQATKVRAAEPKDRIYRRIKIAMTTPGRLVSGSDCEIEVVVTNTGTVPLSGIVLRSVLPPELRGQRGGRIETPIGMLAPGQSRTTTLRVTGRGLGTPRLLAEVSAKEGVSTSVRGSFEVVRSLVADR